MTALRLLLGSMVTLALILGAAWFVPQSYYQTLNTQKASVSDTSSGSDPVLTPEAELPIQDEKIAPDPMSMVGVAPSFDVIRVEASGETFVAGIAEPRSSVEILEGAKIVARAEANERGEWGLAVESKLSAGSHDLALRTISPDKSAIMISDQRIAILVPENGVDEPLVVVDAPNLPNRVIQVPAEPDIDGSTEGAIEPDAADAPGITAPPPSQTPEAVSEEIVSPLTEPSEVPEIEIASAPDIEPVPPVKSEDLSDPTDESGTELATATAPPAKDNSPTADIGSDPPTSVQTTDLPSSAIDEAPKVPVDSNGPAIAQPPSLSVSSVEVETSDVLYVTGIAATGLPVRVYVDDNLVGEALPDDSGAWLIEAVKDMATGTYAIRADQVNAATGDVVARAEVPFIREIDVQSLDQTETAEARDTLDGQSEETKPATITIERGDNLWQISREVYGDGVHYSTIYQANRDQIRDPHHIYPGQIFILPADGDANQFE